MVNSGKCRACFYVKEGKAITDKDYNGKTFLLKVGRKASCESKNRVYLLECDKDNCKKKKNGITHKELCELIYQHVGYMENKILSRATGEHFNLPGHETHQIKFSIIEQVKSSDPLYGREREKLMIRKFNSCYCVINKEH